MAKRVAGQRRPTREPAVPSPARPGGAPASVVPEPADPIVVGRIGRPQGIKGEVTVEVRTDDPDLRFAPGAVLTTETGTLTVVSSRWHGKYLVVAFEGIADRNQAELLRDTLVHIDRSELPELEDEDDFYDSQLIGLAAYVGATAIGAVVDVLHLPGGEVLVIDRDGTEALVPFVRAIVPEVDLATGRLTIDPPPGLLDDPSNSDPSDTDPSDTDPSDTDSDSNDVEQ